MFKFSLLARNFLLSKQHRLYGSSSHVTQLFFRNTGEHSRETKVEERNVTEAYQVCLLVLVTIIHNLRNLDKFNVNKIVCNYTFKTVSVHSGSNLLNSYLQNIQNYVPMQSILPSQSAHVKEMNQADFVSHPPSNYANQLVAEPKSYATLQGIDLNRAEYQQLKK